MRKFQRKLPEEPYPIGVRFIPVPVPDNDLWAATFAGNCYELLRQQHYWERDPTGEGAKNVSAIWQSAYEMFMLQYLSEVEEMSCADVQDCIENEAEIQQTIINIINNGGNTEYNLPVYDVPYYPMPTASFSQNQVIEVVTDPSSCTDDATYGAAIEVVQWIADDIQTFFDLFELLDDPAEVLAIITGGVGIPPASVLTAFLELMNFMKDVPAALWDFSNNSTTQGRLACAIWCNWRDCTGISIETVYETVTFEFDTQSGKNISSLDDLLAIIEEIASGTYLDYTLFTAFVSMWGAFMRFIQRTPFGGGFKTPDDWKTIMRLGYINGDAGHLLCDPCYVEPNCGFYVVNFTTLGSAGLPLGWQASPPANMASDPQWNYFVWADTRGSNQTLRGANFPSYGQTSEEFVQLGAAYDLGEDCTLINLTTDFNYATTTNTKQITAWGLPSSYNWEDRVQIDFDGVPSPGTNEPGIAWSGNITGLRYIVLVGNGVYKSGDGSVSLRFFRVNN